MGDVRREAGEGREGKMIELESQNPKGQKTVSVFSYPDDVTS